jgi:uncharacterized protein
MAGLRPCLRRFGGDAMSQSAKAQEPSMEEILASIRRIIADDESAKPSPPAAKPAPAPPPRPVAAPPRPPAPPPAPPPATNRDEVEAMLAGLDAPSDAVEPESPDVFDLTESMAAAQEPANFRTIDGQTDVVFADAPARPEPPPRMEERRPPPPSQPQPNPADRLMSSSTAASVDSAFNTLAQTVLIQNARTLEDLVKEMLRPMLKSWLDDNLPGLVERIVKAEIERVSRGRTS